MWAVVVAFLTDDAVVLGGGAAILAILETTLAPFRTFARRFRKPEQVVIANPEAFLPKSAPAPHGIQMDVETFTALQSKQRDAARAELAMAHGAERQRLEDKIAALNARLANPDEALAQLHAIILDLEAKPSPHAPPPMCRPMRMQASRLARLPRRRCAGGMRRTISQRLHG